MNFGTAKIFGGLHFWRHWFNVAKILSKCGEQQLVMVNYACGFNQSETGKYFEWIIILFPRLKRPQHLRNIELRGRGIRDITLDANKLEQNSGRKIAPNTGANATKFFILATKSWKLVAKLATRISNHTLPIEI